MFVCKVLLLMILLVLESTYVFSQNECRTIDGAGPQRNKPCMFPFIFEDRVVRSCITGPNRQRPWCSTSTIYESGKWGYCSDTCPNHRTFPNSECGENREHRVIPEDNTDFQYVRGGENTLISKYPWMVSVGVYDAIDDNYEHFCTGSIINRRFVLTAAHCFDASRSNTFEGQTVLLVGTTDLRKRREGDFTFLGIKNKVIHPKYYSPHAYYDVALLELKADIEYSLSQYPICLPNVSSKDLKKRNSHFSILTGWGNGNSTLKKATLRVLSQSECNRRYDVSKYNTNWPKINKTLPQLFEDNLLCAANDEQGSCNGDSGGPLIIENTDTHPNRHIQIGIVTGAAVCGDERFPGAYARVDHPDIWDFIYDTIQINSLESTTSTTTKTTTTTTSQPKRDCIWAQWNNWSKCSKTCGNGIRTRTRGIIQSARNGGLQCQQDQAQLLEQCNSRSCPGTRACGQKEWYLKKNEEMPEDKENPFSWMISISETTFDGKLPASNICGASLIDNETVITAASCFNDWDKDDVMLILGAQHLSDTKEEHRKTRTIKELIIHPKYKKGKAYFDIAIIKMDRPVEFNIYLYPVCLPQVPVTDLKKRDGHAGTIMGWGETEDDDSQQDELGWIQLSVYGKDICNREYQDLKDGKVRNVRTIIHVNKIDEKMPEQFQSNIYCANAFLDYNGACDGDFGGPMTFFNTSDYPGYYTQIGVIQPFLSHICGNPKVPDILTRLEDVEVLDFIYENSLNEKPYNSEDYTTKDEEKD